VGPYHADSKAWRGSILVYSLSGGGGHVAAKLRVMVVHLAMESIPRLFSMHKETSERVGIP
jgi:hypothetical protein